MFIARKSGIPKPYPEISNDQPISNFKSYAFCIISDIEFSPNKLEDFDEFF